MLVRSVVAGIILPRAFSYAHFGLLYSCRPLCVSMSSSSGPSPNNEVKTYLLSYKYVENMADKRTPHRPGHIALAKDLNEQKLLIAAGAFTPELDGALFLFKSSKALVEDFVAKDPYVKNNLVPEWSIKEWNVVVGDI